MRYIITLIIIAAVYSTALPQSALLKHKQGAFSTSGNCAFCHNTDFGVNTVKGKDVSQSSQWRSTMMANAFKDPFFRAKVDAELASVKDKNIQKAAADLCLKCHAPMGFTQSGFENKQGEYSFEKANGDPLANDGVSCTVCHQIQPANFGSPQSFAGGYLIKNDRLIFGPYKDVLSRPMSNHEDFSPLYGAHITKSELCATCHTVITPKVTEDDKLNGVFFEQTPYLEWKNSVFPESDINCQSCHMPAAGEPVDIASRPPWDTTKRAPFFYHQFVGGNVTMQKIFSKNTQTLNLNSPASFYEEKMKESEENLKSISLSLGAEAKLEGSRLDVKVKLENQAGHKLPSGIPFRRMWVHFTLKDESGNVLFESGGYDKDGNIIGQDKNYEQHYDIISNPDQVQIYEAVMADAKGSSTFSLLKADKYIKDNRIPPSGFTSKHPSYDTTAIFGNAKDDPNFNKDSKGEEGSASDIITYRIENLKGNKFVIEAEVLYQTLNPAMLLYFEKYETPHTSAFINAYNNSGIMPVVMKSLIAKIN